MDPVGALLRRLRIAAGLTQEELADRAGISSRSVSDIERGLRTRLYADTAGRIADALNLDPELRSEFLDRARRRGSPGEVGTRRPPAPLAPLIGRDAELRAIADGLAAHRLVTVTGIGGIGKTRLSLAACAQLSAVLGGRVGFVAFTAGDGADRLVSEAGTAVGALPGGGVETIRDAVGSRPFLLVLDAFEHVLASAPLEAMLTRCESLRALVTSRTRVNITGEVEVSLGPLAPSAAVELFRDRAPNSCNADPALVAEVCRLVDRHPLAVELIAARARQLPLGVVHAQLLDRETGADPQLDDAIRTSIDAAGAQSRSVLYAAALFPAGWGLEGLVAVVGERPIAALRELSDRGLVVATDDDFEPRWRMFDLVRERVLAQRPASRHEKEAYVAHHVALVDSLAAHLGAETTWHARLDVEDANVETALGWAAELADATAVLNLAAGSWQHWQSQGRFVHARRWIETGLAIRPPAPIQTRAAAHWALSWLALHQGDIDTLAAQAEALSELAQAATDVPTCRNAATVLGILASAQGRHDDAARHLGDALTFARQLDRPWILGASLLNAGWATLALGDLEGSQTLLLEALRIFDAIGDRRFHARCLANLGMIALEQQDIARAEALFRQSLGTFAKLREPGGTAEGLDALAAAAADRDDPVRAATLAGAAEKLRELYAAHPLRFEGRAIEDRLRSARLQIAPEVWANAWSDGHALELDRAIVLGLA